MKNYMFFMILSKEAHAHFNDSIGLLSIYCLTTNFPCAISFAGERREMINMQGVLEK